MVQAFFPNGILVPFQFYSVSVPSFSIPFLFGFAHVTSIKTCYFPCVHNGSVNTSFGVENGLQLLHMVADGSKYESASISEAGKLLANR